MTDGPYTAEMRSTLGDKHIKRHATRLELYTMMDELLAKFASINKQLAELRKDD